MGDSAMKNSQTCTGIQHRNIFDTDKIAQHYSEKDGVPIKYVCTSAIDGGLQPMDIFYRETPHPEFGNRYFGLFDCAAGLGIFITNADKIEDLEFHMIEDNQGDLHYSRHRHDYFSVDDKFIDGGRAYSRSNTPTRAYKVKDGGFHEVVD